MTKNIQYLNVELFNLNYKHSFTMYYDLFYEITEVIYN